MASDHDSLQGAGNPHSPAPLSFACNLNDYIRFRPNDLTIPYLLGQGEKMYHYITDDDYRAECISGFRHFGTPDESGWCRMQIHLFCALFGAGLSNGLDPIVDTEVEIERHGQ